MSSLPILGSDVETWSAKLNEFLSVSHHEDGRIRGVMDVANVKDFGAIGDGIADDTAAIQQAIDQMMGAGGGTVLIPAGVYLISAALTITAPFITILGPGKLFKQTGTKTFTIKITAPWVEINGLQIDGNRDGQSQFYWAYDEIRLEDGASNCRITRCSIENSAGTGIAGYRCSHNIAAYNRIRNCYDNGVFFGGLGADYNQILFNDVDGTTKQNGIFVSASPGSGETTDYIFHNKIIGNTVKNVGDTCIESGIHAVSTVISNNHAMDPVAAAILVRDNEHTIVQSNFVDMTNSPLPQDPNKLRTDDGIAIYAHHGDKPDSYSICANNIIKSGRYGIHIGGHNHVTLNGNAIYNSRETPIFIAEGHKEVIPRHINREGQVVHGETVPLVQYTNNLVLARSDEIGLVKLEFENGAKMEYALLYVYPESGSGDNVGYQVIKCSSGISATTNRNADWAITKGPYHGYVILQRRGTTIEGNRPYTLTFAGTT